MSDYYKNTLDTIILDLERSNAEWAGAIRKWRSFLARAAYLISETTGELPEDALGGILESVTFVFDMYRGDIFKHAGILYRVREVRDGIATVCAVRRCTREKEGLLKVCVDDLEPVKRGKMDTMMYHCVYQQYVNTIRSNFTSKNGFGAVAAEDALTIVGFGLGGKKLVRKSYTKHERQVTTIALSGVSAMDTRNYLGDSSLDPEACVSVMEFLEGIEENLVDADMQIFELLLEDSSYTLQELSADTGFSSHRVRSARRRIKKSFNDITKGLYVNYGC